MFDAAFKKAIGVAVRLGPEVSMTLRAGRCM